MSLLSHAGDGAVTAEVTWLWCNVVVETGWQ
jgi:hypothetical protein